MPQKLEIEIPDDKFAALQSVAASVGLTPEQVILSRMIGIDRAAAIVDRRRKYPFSRLNIGEFFTVPIADHDRIRQAACHYGRRNGVRFSCNVNADGGITCTRTA